MPVSAFPGKVEDITLDIWDRELNVHAKGVFLGTRTAIPAMRKGGGGSDHQYVLGDGPGRQSHLAGLFGREGRHHVVHQVGGAAIREGKYPYQFGPPGLCGYAADRAPLQRPAVRQELIDRTPMGRLGTAEDIANGVLFLASDESPGSPARNW